MNNQITTAAELDALPNHSVIRISDGADPNAAICYDLPEGRRWFTTVDAPSATGDGYTSQRLAEYYINDNEWGLPTLLVTPDAEPVREATQPTEDQVLWTILAHDSHSASPDNSEVRCSCGFVEWKVGIGWTEGPVAEGGQLDRLAHCRHAARAVLALLPQRCAPTEHQITRAIREAVAEEHEGAGFGGPLHVNDWTEACDDGQMASRIAALYASQPTVREARAAGWDKGYRRAQSDHCDYSPSSAECDITSPNPYRSEADHG